MKAQLLRLQTLQLDKYWLCYELVAIKNIIIFLNFLPSESFLRERKIFNPHDHYLILLVFNNNKFYR